MISKYSKAILDNSPVSIVLIGRHHEVLAFNKSLKEVLFQYHNREIKEGDFYYPDFVIESHQPLYLEAFERAINGQPFSIQTHTKNANASIWFEYKMQPFYDGEEVVGVTLSADNKTLEKEAELKIIDLSEKLKAILDNTDESITLLDLDYKILVINEVAKKEAKLNTSSDTLTGQDFRNFVTDKNNLFYEYYPKAVTGEGSLVEISYQSASGELEWHQTKFNPVYAQSGEQIGVSIFAKNVTKNKHLEFSLKESEERFRKITNLAPIGILITNTAFNITYANLTAKKILGYDEKELYSLSVTDLISNLTLNSEYKLRVDNINKDIETPIFNQEQFVAIAKNKAKLNVLLSSSSFLTQNEQSYIFIFQDITDINEKDSLIAEQNTRLRDIAWYQSHIIRAPLARIMGLVSLLQIVDINEKERTDFYRAILDSTKELDKVISDIVDKTE